MLHISYKQLKLGDSTKSCSWLWVNFHLKGCLEQFLIWKKSSISLLFVSLYNHCNGSFLPYFIKRMIKRKVK